MGLTRVPSNPMVGYSTLGAKMEALPEHANRSMLQESWPQDLVCAKLSQSGTQSPSPSKLSPRLNLSGQGGVSGPHMTVLPEKLSTPNATESWP